MFNLTKNFTLICVCFLTATAASGAIAGPRELSGDAHLVAHVLLANPAVSAQLAESSTGILSATVESLPSDDKYTEITRYVLKGLFYKGDIMAPGAVLTATETTSCTAGGDGPCTITWQTELRTVTGKLIPKKNN